MLSIQIRGVFKLRQGASIGRFVGRSKISMENFRGKFETISKIFMSTSLPLMRRDVDMEGTRARTSWGAKRCQSWHLLSCNDRHQEEPREAEKTKISFCLPDILFVGVFDDDVTMAPQTSSSLLDKRRIDTS